MLSIGIIGPPLLLHQNRTILQQAVTNAEDIAVIPLRQPRQMPSLDGLLITGWRLEDYARQLFPLRSAIGQNAERLSLFGIAAGAVALGRPNLAVMDFTATCHPAPAFTAAMLDVPGFAQNRFAAVFLPRLCFTALAPSLGILCEKSCYGPVVIRQGNHLACSYLAELTPPYEIYRYWLQMVADLQNSREL